MNHHQQFVMVVQTGILIMAAERQGWGHNGPLTIVARAAALPEEVVPEDVEVAALEFVQFQCGLRPEPEWHEAWRESCESSDR